LARIGKPYEDYEAKKEIECKKRNNLEPSKFVTQVNNISEKI